MIAIKFKVVELARFVLVLAITLFSVMVSAADTVDLSGQIRRLPAPAEAGDVGADVAASSTLAPSLDGKPVAKQVGYFAPSAPAGTSIRMPAGTSQYAQSQFSNVAANAHSHPSPHFSGQPGFTRNSYAPGYPVGPVRPVSANGMLSPNIEGVGGCNVGTGMAQPMMQMQGPPQMPMPQTPMGTPMMASPIDMPMQQMPVQNQLPVQAPFDGGFGMQVPPQAPPVAAAPAGGGMYDSLWTDGANGWDGGYSSNAYTANGCASNVNAGSLGRCRSLCGCDPCAPSTWFRAEVLLGWLSGYRTPAILSKSPTGTAIDDFSDDQVIYGGGDFGRDLRVGGRLSGGYWFDECRKIGVQAEGFSLGNNDDDIDLVSNGDPFIFRPFLNTATGVSVPDGQVIAYAGSAIGSFRASTTGRMVSAAPSLRWNVNCCGDACSGNATRLDLVAGYRYLQLREGFASQEILRPQDGSYAAGTSFTLRDNIDTQNDFHGFELGGIFMQQRGALTTEIQAMAAFGNVDRLYTLDGSTTLFVPNAVNETYAGGFLVRPEDIGSYSENEFTVVPQLRANLSYCVCENVQLTMGYNFLYLKNVFRPGPLMSTEFNGNDLGTNPDPGVVGSGQPKNSKTDVFLSTLSFGATYSF